MKDVVLLVGAGQIGTACARRIGSGKKIVVADKNLRNAEETAKALIGSGFDAETTFCDI